MDEYARDLGIELIPCIQCLSHLGTGLQWEFASGIKDVISFDDETLLLNTALGKLTVKGQGIKIESFNTETGDLTATGNFHATVYMADSSNEGGFISRIFR